MSVKPRRRRFVRNRGGPGGNAMAYVFIAPAMLWIFGLFSYSILYNLYTSFYRVGLGGMASRRFVGLENYRKLLISREFWEVVGNTVIWVAVITAVLEIIALCGALLLSQKIAGRGIYRTILLLPWVIPGVVTGILWKYMFDTKFGVINDLLQRLRLIDLPVPWLGQSGTALYAVIAAYIWKVFPLAMILLLGSIQGISEDIYEAAEIEGAGTVKKLVYVTLPLLRGTILSTTIFTMITAFSSYDLTYIMTGGGPVNSSEILGKYVYNLGFVKFDFGGASATGTIMFAASMLLIVLYVCRQNRKEE